ncbi:MAG: dihydrofolate reductase, partial [Tannerellaceae bacterium]|nr:dihydrofolate reductase [Tannerellaceae bacterium]
MTLSLIAALDEQGAIGYTQNLLCHLPNDLKHFKKLTLGHTVIMGRKTFESLPGGALPQRKNVILSSKISVSSLGGLVYPSWETVMKAVESDGEVFVIGGVSIYRQALPLADTLYLTRIHHTFAQA